MSSIPVPVTKQLPDGSTLVSVGEFNGIVSSSHLIEPKVHQLQTAWLNKYDTEK